MAKTGISWLWDWPWRFKLDITRKEQIQSCRTPVNTPRTELSPLCPCTHLCSITHCFYSFYLKKTTHLHYRKCIWLSLFNHGVLKTEAAETPSSPVDIPWQRAPPKTQSQGAASEGWNVKVMGVKAFGCSPRKMSHTNGASRARAPVQAGMNWNQNYRSRNYKHVKGFVILGKWTIIINWVWKNTI